MTANEKLEALRKSMRANGIHAYIIPSADPHLDEYVPEHYKARAWISGFTGSAGTVVVTFDKAVLWTDGRYYIQASRQIRDSEFELYKMEKGIPDYIEFIEQNLSRGQGVGFDGRVLPCADVLKMKRRFEEQGIFMKSGIDLVSRIWTEDRPVVPKDKAFLHDAAFAGLSVKEKLAQVLAQMEKNKSGSLHRFRPGFHRLVSEPAGERRILCPCYSFLSSDIKRFRDLVCGWEQADRRGKELFEG